MKKILFFIPFFFIKSYLFSDQPVPVGPFNFGGGYNPTTHITEIRDNQSPDMCDCVSNFDGSMEERYGNKLFIDKELSSSPIKNIYRAYASSGTTEVRIVIAINGNKIVYSTSDTNPQWIVLSSGITAGQNWSFTTMNNEVIMTGDKLVDDIKTFNLYTSSFMNLFDKFSVVGNSEAVKVRSKYLVKKDNYLLFINARDVTNGSTYYPSGVFYSLLNLSSPIATYNRFFEVRTNDGEELTGGGVMLDAVDLFKQSSAHELTFSVLNLGSLGGNQAQEEIVNGFGLKAPRTLQNLGNFYVLGSQDGIRLWDGGRRSRLNVAEESRIISNDIKVLIDKLIEKKTYEKMVCKYYKKREWLIFSYEHPDRFPKGVNNSIIVYDLRLGQWYPLCGMTAESFETFDSAGDDGTLLWGNSNDGLVYKFDQKTAIDDPPHQLIVDTMDSSSAWVGTNLDSNYDNPAEGTGSLRIGVNADVTTSSMTLMRNLNLGEYYDKVKVSKSTGEGFNGDYLQFKVNSTSWPAITNLRIDLLVNDIASQFDGNFTSVTLATDDILKFSSYTVGGTTWIICQVALSSFPIRPDWASFDSETVPFARSLFYYGLRFSLTGGGVISSSVSIDSVRVVQEVNPINFYRFTKLFDLGTISKKTLGELLISMEKSADSVLHIDIYNDFGKKVKTETFEPDIKKEIIVFGLVSTASISIVDDITWKIKRSTVLNSSEYYPFNGVATKDHIFFTDRTNNRWVKMRRDNFVIVSTFGSLGSGTTNQNTIHQIDIDENGNVYGVDINNQRIKKHRSDNLTVITLSGSLGDNSTSYHQPTGITTDGITAFIADEGNYRWKNINVSTLGFNFSRIIDYNTIGDTTLEQDENFVYGAYNKTSEARIFYQDIALESRFKGNLDLVNRKDIYPDDKIEQSTYSLQGDIGLRNRYSFISFAKDSLSSSPDYYIQKRLKDGFDLVSQFKTKRRIFSVIADPFSHLPSTIDRRKPLGTEGRYIQIKYYDSGSDNRIKLINQTFLVEDKPITYRGGDN